MVCEGSNILIADEASYSSCRCMCEKIIYFSGRMEVAKRKKALEMMGETHPLHPLAIECLHDKPASRPKTEELNKRLTDLCTHQYPKSFADILDVTDEVSCVPQNQT